MDKLKAIESFVTVSKAGTFAAAAKSLGVSTAMISKRIRQLEEHLTVRLFHRTTRKVSLTEAGTHYLQVWDQILETVEEEEATLSELQSEPRGVLRIAAARSLGAVQVAPAIADFAKLYPDLRVELDLIATSPTAVHLVERGCDLGIRIIPPPPGSRAVARKLADYDWVLCASPDYVKNHGQPRAPDDLLKHRCIVTPHMNAQVHYNSEWVFTKAGHKSSVKVKPVILVNSLTALRGIAIRAGGIARLPSFCIEEDLRSGRLVRLLKPYKFQPGAIYITYYRGGGASGKVRLFVNFLQKRLRRPSAKSIVNPG